MIPGAAGRSARIDPGASYGVTTPYTTDHTLTSEQSGFWATNEGATGTVTLTAPASPTVGDWYTLHRLSSYDYAFRFQPGSGHRVEGEAADKYVEMQGPGVLVVEYTRTGVWAVIAETCVWNPEP